MPWQWKWLVACWICAIAASAGWPCCGLAEDERIDCLWRDVRSQYETSLRALVEGASPSILLVTYFTRNIVPYSLYAFDVNRQFARLHGYGIIPTTPETGHQFDTNDQRWNKVKIMLDLLEIAPPNQVLVWIDSDLIFNIHSFRLESLLDERPATDLFIASEVDPRNGIANSGCVILRNTPWVKYFLSLWWNGYDRAGGMDQHIFDQLYRDTSVDCASHIAILPANSINSVFPGLVTYQNTENVLHLAGESNFIRAHIMAMAANRSCAADYAVDRPLVSREALDDIDYIQLHEQEWRSILKDLDTSLPSQANNLSYFDSVRYRVREAQQSASKFLCTYTSLGQTVRRLSTSSPLPSSSSPSSPPAQCTQLGRRFEPAARQALWAVFCGLQSLFRATEASPPASPPASLLSQPSLGLLQSTLDGGFEYLLVAAGDGPHAAVLSALHSLIHVDLLPRLSPQALPGAVAAYAVQLDAFRASHALHTHTADTRPRHPPSLAWGWATRAFATWRHLFEAAAGPGRSPPPPYRFREGLELGRQWVQLACVQAVYSEGHGLDGGEEEEEEAGGLGDFLLRLAVDAEGRGAREQAVHTVDTVHWDVHTAVQLWLPWVTAMATLSPGLQDERGGNVRALDAVLLRLCGGPDEDSLRGECLQAAEDSLCPRAAAWRRLRERSEGRPGSSGFPAAVAENPGGRRRFRRKTRETPPT